MKRPWSLSTTVRNPERVVHFTAIVKEMEGELFDTQNQIKFQKLLIQHKRYMPSNITGEEREYFVTDKEMDYATAERIFDRQNYRDPPMRGRQSFAITKKMGFCTGTAKTKIRVTESGKDLLSGAKDMGDLFFVYFLKWQLPNPIETGFSAGFNIRPFLGTLHLISRVNALWKEQGKKPVGISKEEFSLFVPTLINYKDIGSQASKLIEFRKLAKTRRKAFKEKFVREFAGDEERAAKILKNLKDYGDNAMRYFRLTRYVWIRGNGYYVDLEPRRAVEISQLLEHYDGSVEDIRFTETAYSNYLSDVTQAKIPWERDDVQERILEHLDRQITTDREKLRGMDIPLPPKPDIDELKKKQGREEIREHLREHILTLQKTKQHHDMSKPENIAACAETLANIYKQSNRALELEKQAALALTALNDAIQVKPNYPVGDDGEPTFTAPGGVPDIECYYEGYNMVCEVTMLNGRDQWVNEGYPVQRHLREFEEKNGEKQAYCLFIAPKIHADTMDAFWASIKYGSYRGKKQKIVPLKIKQFVEVLGILREYREKKRRHMPHGELQALYDSIIEYSDDVDDALKWLNNIPEALESWRRNVLT